jgi:hypothetical protein
MVFVHVLTITHSPCSLLSQSVFFMMPTTAQTRTAFYIHTSFAYFTDFYVRHVAFCVVMGLWTLSIVRRVKY